MRAKPVSINSEGRPEPRERGFSIGGIVLSAPKAAPGLYVVATPIGNLGDITVRALETLAGVDFIACEDTRITRRLMERYGISAQLRTYHEHNAADARPKMLESLAQGQSVALVSDAGTPLISDPGFKLVREVCAAGHAVTAIPGPSSVLAAMSVAALPTNRFFFEGFLPPRQTARRARLRELAPIDATLVLFEAGSRVQETVRDLSLVMRSRDIAVCRELTKLHEEVTRGTIGELADHALQLDARGEFVLVIGPPADTSSPVSPGELDAMLRRQLEQGSVKDAVSHVVEMSGLPRRQVYARALELVENLKGNDGKD